MKRFYSLLVIGLALALSCTKEDKSPINEVKDLYTEPTAAATVELSNAKSTWAADRRYFDLSFGSALTTTLVGYDALLTPGQYLLGGDEVGNAVLAKTKVGGAAAKEGYILVNEQDGTYRISASIDGTTLKWEGKLPFVPDPDPTKLSVVLQAQGNAANKLVTMQLATAGISSHMDESYQTVWDGEGKYLAVDLYSEDGYLHDGQYKASAAGGVVNAGEFGIGYDTTVDWGFGPMEMKDWGTCLWTVSGGAATAAKITDGIVVVSSRKEKVEDKDTVIWTLYWGKDYPVDVIFEGAIPALTKPEKPAGPVTPDYLYTEEVTPEEGGAAETHTVTITDKEGNELAHLEFLTEVGATDLSGSYPSTSYASQPGQLKDGWTFMDIMSGGSYYIQDGEKQYIGAGTATVDVTKIAEGAYLFSCAFFSYAAAGPDYVPGAGAEGLPATAETVATDNAGIVQYNVTVTDGGETVAYFEFVINEGDALSGDYVSTEYASRDGVVHSLCNGYFIDMGDWGSFSGGSYYVQGGEKVFIDPGVTVTVTSLGGTVYQFDVSTGYSVTADIQ